MLQYYSLIVMGVLYAIQAALCLFFVWKWAGTRAEVRRLTEDLYRNARRHQIEKAALKIELEREKSLAKSVIDQLAARQEMDLLEEVEDAIDDLEDGMNWGDSAIGI